MRDLYEWPEGRRVPPGEHPAWDRALVLLNRDLAATLPEQEPLQLLALPTHPFGGDDAPNIYVAMADGGWHGNCLFPESADDDSLALAVIADAAQESVTECLWQAWPLCDEHGLGMHPRAADGQLSWWCAGVRSRPGTDHIRAAVGALDTVIRVRRPNRKKKQRTQ